MNGEWLGTRAIRVNWANQKTQTGARPPPQQHAVVGPSGMVAAPMNAPQPPMGMGIPPHGHGGHMHARSPAPQSYSPAPALSYEAVAAQTPDYNSTVYVGNLIPYTTQADLIPLFQGYGYIVELRMQADRGFAFVKLDTHHNAAMAITHLQNQLVHGRPIKCSWGKDKAPGEAGHTPAPQGQYPVVSYRLYNALRTRILMIDGLPQPI